MNAPATGHRTGMGSFSIIIGSSMCVLQVCVSVCVCVCLCVCVTVYQFKDEATFKTFLLNGIRILLGPNAHIFNINEKMCIINRYFFVEPCISY